MSQYSDAEILNLIESDANAGFRALLQQFQQPIYYHVRQMVYKHEDANDVTQEVFIKVFRNLDKFKGESKLFTWIYRIATNESLNFIKKKARKDNVSYEDVAYEMARNLEADAYFDGDAAMLKLEQAVAQLPEKQQIVFKMKYFEEMKYEEIAEILGISPVSSRTLVHRGKKKLQEKLKDKYYGTGS